MSIEQSDQQDRPEEHARYAIIDLPSGGWARFLKRPTAGEMVKFQATAKQFLVDDEAEEARKAALDDAVAAKDEAGAKALIAMGVKVRSADERPPNDIMLLSTITAWSLGDVTWAIYEDVDLEDQIALWTGYMEHVNPFLDRYARARLKPNAFLLG